MKKVLVLVWIFVAGVVFAEKITFPAPPSQAAKTAGTPDNTGVFTNVISEMEVEKITVQGQDFTALQLEGYVYHGQAGYPKLPAKTRLLEIPICTTVEVKILSSEYVDIDLPRKGYSDVLFPVQPPIRKSAKQEQAIVRNDTAYGQKSFTVRDLVDVMPLGIRKDVQLAQLNICPVQYLPAENVVRVHYVVEYELVFTSVNAPAKAQPTSKKIAGALVYQIVSDRKFESTLAPFVAWKTQKGFDVRVAYTDQPEVGNTNTSIKSYLTNIYNSEDRADYLLLVGDVEEIPPFPTSFSNSHWLIEDEPHVTDLYYAEYTGDYLPDLYYGRLSATTPQQLNNQIEKILVMEQLSIPSTDFLGESMLIAGWETDSYLIAQLNAAVTYGETNYFNASNNIDVTVYLSPSSNNSATTIRSQIGDGMAFVNYTGHGEWNMWQYPQVAVSNVANFSNTNRYPFMIGNCCLTNKFDRDACFGETLLRAERKGAVTYIGASSYTYFDEDLQWVIGPISSCWNCYPPNSLTRENTGLGVYDRMFHTHGEAYEDWASTVGEIMYYGNMAVQLGSATWSDDVRKYYWEIYHTLGDPSYMPYLKKPLPLNCDHPAEIVLSETGINVSTAGYAYAGLSRGGQLLSAGRADETGQLTLDLPQELFDGFLTLTVTAPNYEPYIANISAGDVTSSKTLSEASQNTFDVMIKDGILQARINAEKPAKATIRLVNMLGQTVATVASNGTLNAGPNDFYFNMSSIPGGAYVCTYFDGVRLVSRKIVW